MKIIFTQKQIPEISERIIKKIMKNKNDKACVVAFSGDLGAGKTTITKELAKQFGIKDKIISPTFVIMKFYNINLKSKYYFNFKKLIHIDAYRLKKGKDIDVLGWQDIVSDKENLVIIEWPDDKEPFTEKYNFDQDFTPR